MRRSFLTIALLVAPLCAAQPRLYVSGFFASSVYRYDATRTAATFANNVLRRPWGIAFGPDANLYVANASGSTPAIARVDGPFSATPGVVHSFVDAGGFFDLAFGPDGMLYAAGRGAVQRFDITTGAATDFTRGYALTETRGIAFGADGYLYVSNYEGCVMGPSGCSGTRGEVVRFDAYSGAFVDVYVRDLGSPWKIAFGRNGELLVINWTPSGNSILRIPPRNALTRVRQHAPAITHGNWFPLYVALGPDGNLYVSDGESSGSAGSVLRFDGKSGAFLDTYIANVEGGPRGLAFAIR
ncbi:MAG TPA: hypothetical protein VF824_13095 [Thermoanaerobaculia bacterium]